MLVAIMLNHEQGTELQLHSCDMNQDGLIDIEDIVLLFQWILEIDMSIRSELSTGEYQVSEEKVVISSDGDIAGFQIILSDQDMEIDLSLPPGWEYFLVQNKLVAYGMDGSSLPNNFPFFIQDHKAIQSIKLVGWNKTSAYATKAVIPRSFLLKAMPNPFNPGCKISFLVKESGSIDISLFDMAGKYVQSISNGQFFEGEHQIYWEPENISSGVYFIRINDGRDFQNKKVLYLK